MSDQQTQRWVEGYAASEDRETAALISINRSIGWLCWPRFDSGPCFAALLGGPEHGRWLMAPKDETTTRVTRRIIGTCKLWNNGSWWMVLSSATTPAASGRYPGVTDNGHIRPQFRK